MYLLVNVLMFWDWFARNWLLCFHSLPCNNLTRWFFLEVPRFEELQDSNRSPRREEVGRRTLGAIGGALLPFFYRHRFQLFTQHFLLFYREASTTITQKPPDTLRVEESNSARKVLHV